MKKCSTCHKNKPLCEFYKDCHQPSGYKYACKVCTKITDRDYKLKGMYGLTRSQYQAMQEKQGGLCAICGQAKPLVVDHNHQTGSVRQLLCGSCNHIVTYHVEAQPEILLKAFEYINYHQER